MPRFNNPETVHKPLGKYSHAALAPRGSDLLHVSGQVGVTRDGTVPDSVDQQSENAWANAVAILEANGMAIENIVKVNAYLVDPDDLAAFGAVRDRFLGDHRPASTLVYVSALVKPALKVEIDLVATRE